MPATDPFRKRIALLQSEMRKRKLDSFIVTRDVNVAYLSGFGGHDAAIFINKGVPAFLADSRYIEEAGDTVRGFDVRLSKGTMHEAIESVARSRKSRRVGFESTDLSYAAAVRLKDYVKPAELVAVRDLVESLRAVKDASEISLIRRSVAVAKDVLGEAARHVTPGETEESIARRIERLYLERGVKSAFDPIVAVDSNSSKPHARPTGRKVRRGSFAMIDTGCIRNGYNSDITRIVMTGKLGAEMKKIYGIVSSASSKAIEAVKPGVPLADIDRAARSYIESRGFGKYFGHALGHGVGLEVHEKPSVSRAAEGLLKPGMVFTIEPAVYLPKTGGIRIEDMVLVTGTGCEVLTV